MAEYLQKAGYATHAVGKWHLGLCDDRYMATYRGFDSFQGYMHGAEGYWKHAGDFRNSSSLDKSAGVTPQCVMPDEVDGIYSGTLESAQVARIVAAHDATKPLFMYLALHSVHGPNEDPYECGNGYETLYPNSARGKGAGGGAFIKKKDIPHPPPPHTHTYIPNESMVFVSLAT